MKIFKIVAAIIFASVLILVIFPNARQPIADLIYHAVHGRITDDRLAEEVKSSIIQKYKADGAYIGVITSLILVRKNGNEYTGMLKISDYNPEHNGRKREIPITVIYDGESLSWQFLDK